MSFQNTNGQILNVLYQITNKNNPHTYLNKTFNNRISSVKKGRRQVLFGEEQADKIERAPFAHRGRGGTREGRGVRRGRKRPAVREEPN
jgi:hypothetical protein